MGGEREGEREKEKELKTFPLFVLGKKTGILFPEVA